MNRLVELKKFINSTGINSEISRNYLFPEEIAHMELPNLIRAGRGVSDSAGYLEPELKETCILLRAYGGVQYGNFIRHLLHSFISDTSMIFLSEEPNMECAVCKKPLIPKTVWEEKAAQNPNNPEVTERKFRSYGSTSSTLCMCRNCLIQLKNLDDIMKDIEGEDYLRYRK